jgi:hypothetical protein
MEDIRTFGPVQMLSVAFDGWHFRGKILPELERLKNTGAARVIDLLVIRKDSSGAITKVTATDFEWEEATQYGAHIGTLIGLGIGGEDGPELGAIAGAAAFADGHLFKPEDAEQLIATIPEDTTVAILLLEHLWLRPLQDAVDEANGYELSNHWIMPGDLVRLGLHAATAQEN